MTPQMATNILERAHPQASTTNNSQHIGLQMQQMAFDFESCNLITDAIAAESVSDIPQLLEIPVEPETNADGLTSLELDNGSYVQLAINLLLTCAEDLVSVDKVLNDPAAHTRSINNAKLFKEATTRWLRDDLPNSPFPFSGCVALLEDELRYQSMGQIALPAITERSSELADWILSDPHQAKDVLGRYLTIFSRNDEDYLDLDDDFDEEGGPARERPRT